MRLRATAAASLAAPPPPHPYLVRPELFVSGLTSEVEDVEIVKVLKDCLRVRLQLERDASNRLSRLRLPPRNTVHLADPDPNVIQHKLLCQAGSSLKRWTRRRMPTRLAIAAGSALIPARSSSRCRPKAPRTRVPRPRFSSSSNSLALSLPPTSSTSRVLSVRSTPSRSSSRPLAAMGPPPRFSKAKRSSRTTTSNMPKLPATSCTSLKCRVKASPCRYTTRTEVAPRRAKAGPRTRVRWGVPRPWSCRLDTARNGVRRKRLRPSGGARAWSVLGSRLWLRRGASPAREVPLREPESPSGLRRLSTRDPRLSDRHRRGARRVPKWLWRQPACDRSSPRWPS